MCRSTNLSFQQREWKISKAEAKHRAAIEEIAKNAYAGYLPLMDKKPFPMLDDYNRHIANGNAYILEEKGRGTPRPFMVSP